MNAADYLLERKRHTRITTQRTVMVSGGFDPLHSGHLRYLYNAATLGDHLIIVVNSDRFLLEKKGYFIFDEQERIAQLSLLRFPTMQLVALSQSTDDTVCRDIEIMRPDIFAKGGDRHPKDVPIPEEELCNKLGITIKYGIGGYVKTESSSWAVERAFKRMEVLRGK